MPNGGNLLPSVFTVRKCFKSFIWRAIAFVSHYT
jgi:hypothetical protein